jgi:hypothetical protein
VLTFNNGILSILPSSYFYTLKPKMKAGYRDLTYEQVMEKTGKILDEWMQILDAFNTTCKKSNEVVAMLQNDPVVPRYCARILTTHYLKKQ